MPLADIQTSFAGGELSPQLYSRVDLDKFQVGAALLRNFFADYRGGATNRPGTKFIADLTDLGWPLRLLPFVVSTEASYVLVFSEALVSIYSDETFVTSVVTPYAADDLALLKYAQSADVLTLTHPSYAPANLSRTSVSSFSYDLIAVGPAISPPAITAVTAPHTGQYNFGYLITAVDLEGKEESLPSNIGVQHSEAMNETSNRVIGIKWTAPSEPVSRYNIYKWGPIDKDTMIPATVWGFIGSSQSPGFTDNNIAPDYSKQPPGWGDPFSGGQITSIAVTAPGSGYNGSGGFAAIPFVPLSISGDGTGAAGYAVIDKASGGIIGAYLTNPGKNYTSATVTANGEGGTNATFTVTFSDAAPLFPACVSYLSQRRVFGGADLKPETMVLSQTGLYNNFNITPISLATDAIVFSLASLEVNTIKAMVPVSYGMLSFTTGGSFLINGGAPYAAVTPDNISAQAQVSSGANDLPPLNVNANILYGQAKGNRIRNLAFAWQKQSYSGSDLSTLAAHLFDDYLTMEWCWAEEPFKLVWAVRDDGKLLTLTYVPDQEVYAWARHDTQGLFRSICSIPESNVNAVYTIVERYLPPTSDRSISLTRTGRPTVQFEGGSAGGTLFLAHNVVGTLHIGDAVFGDIFDPAAVITSQDSGTPGGDGVYHATGCVLGDVTCSLMAGTVAGTVLTVTDAGPDDALEIGAFVFGTGIADGTYITSLGTGTGGVGTYNLNQASTVASAVTLTSQFGWHVPADWNDADNTITVVGCGGDGGPGNIGLSRGGGGGGSGAFAQSTNVTLVPGTYVPYQVGLHGRFNNAFWGGGTWFNGVDVDLPDVVWPNKIAARGGGSGDDTGVHDGGSGGNTGAGDVVVLGAAGGDGEDFGVGVLPAAAGGGAGAPWTGASDGGDDALTGNGGDGGDANAGATLGGAGATASSNSVAGTDGPEVASFGAGSGGGGGSATTGHLDGANAGAWGAGGGGAGRDGSSLGNPGVGTNGHITISYTSSVPLTCAGWRWYLERFDNRLTNCLERAWFLDAAIQMPLNAGDGEFKIDAPSGETTLTYCDDEVGHEFSEGDVIVIGCTRVNVTEVIDAETYTVTIIGDLDAYLIPGDPESRLRLFVAEDWEWVTPTDLVTGLDHLAGKEVWTLADGKVDGPRTVNAGGAIELAAPAAIKTTGLLFQQQIKTLYLTMEGLNQGTEQGKRKQITGVTARVDNTLGLKSGTNFDQLSPIPDLIASGDPAVAPIETFTGDARNIAYPDWNTRGEVCIQQDLPLPAQVLGIIVEVTPGDTGR